MKYYKKGEKPLLGDTIEHIDADDDDIYLDNVSSINEDGTIDVNNGLGVLHDLDPGDFVLVSRRADAIELDFQVSLNGMSDKEFNLKFSAFLKENGLTII